MTDNTLDALLDEAKRENIAQRYRRGTALYKEVIKTDPENALAYQGLAYGLIRLGRMDEALESIQRALEINPNSAEAHSNLGYIYSEKKEYSESEQELRRAIQIDSGMAETYVLLGSVLSRQKSYQEAEVALQNAIKLEPDFVPAYSILSLVYAKQNHYVRSIKTAVAPLQQTFSLRALLSVITTLLALYPPLTYSLTALVFIGTFFIRSLLTLPFFLLFVGLTLKTSIDHVRERRIGKAIYIFALALAILLLYAWRQL